MLCLVWVESVQGLVMLLCRKMAAGQIRPAD